VLNVARIAVPEGKNAAAPPLPVFPY